MKSTYSPQEFGELIGRATKTLQKWEREGKLKARRFPTLAARLTETPPAGFREVAISRDARGNYDASFGSKRAKCKKKSLPSTSTRAAKQFVFRMHFVSFQEGFERLSRVDTVSLPCEGGPRSSKPKCDQIPFHADRVAQIFNVLPLR